MFSGVKGPLVAAALALFSYGLIQAYSALTDHLDYVATLKKETGKLTEENDTLNEQVGSLKQATLQQQDHIGVLETELTAREAALQEHLIRQKDLETRLAKLSEDSRNAIINITTEIKRAGLQGLRVPESVIRMQRERARQINARNNHNNESSNPAPEAGNAIPAVSDTRG
ncbi:hypothetical protein K9O81_18550 [Leclercia adecarboxylata]|uniref:hypothetical protein n=1 Tax=Leclercia adecarboxylata TaxID=83655 RepID=UPI001CBFB809|nr:hypothetical protein [Leclercia adecarboxylata]MBZ3802465.1 hypothetical protein [Leclercia adecarboxylata]MBZ3807009.1 hypothetical protein [Leclercia adecarboxylata]